MGQASGGGALRISSKPYKTLVGLNSDLSCACQPSPQSSEECFPLAETGAKYLPSDFEAYARMQDTWPSFAVDNKGSQGSTVPKSAKKSNPSLPVPHLANKLSAAAVPTHFIQ